MYGADRADILAVLVFTGLANTGGEEFSPYLEKTIVFLPLIGCPHLGVSSGVG